MNKPLVSVVISTKNEEKNIENCLKSIVFQTYPKENIEIIVVDNSSTDRTKEISQKYTDKVFNKGPERSAQRNHGMLEKSSGEYLIFLDADMILSPFVVSSCVKKLEDDSLAGLYIKEIVLGNNYFSKVRRFERSFYDGTVVDGVRFLRKEIFEKVGGFDEDLYAAEDWDLDKRIREHGRIKVLESGESLIDKSWGLFGFIKDRGVDPSDYGCVIFHNEAEFNLKKYLSKKGYYSKNFDKYIKKWGEDDKDIKKQFGFWYRYFGIFLENGKWKRLIGRIDLALGMYFLRFTVGLSFIFRKRE